MKVHSKENNTATSSDLNIIEPFKIKSKQKWTPKETHHTIDTVIDLIENDVNIVKTRKTKILKPKLTKEEKITM